MGESFATAAALATRLGRVFTPAEAAMVDAMLEDASAHLRLVIGQRVYPATEATFTVRLGGGVGSIALPQQPVRDVTRVVCDGVEITPDHDGAAVYVPFGARRVQVTFTYGYDEPPDELVTWCCVLASQALQFVEDIGQLTSGGVSSISIDDYRKAWANTDGWALPRHVEELLQSRFGTQTFVTGTRS